MNILLIIVTLLLGGVQPSGVVILAPERVSVSSDLVDVLKPTDIGDAKVWCVFLTNEGDAPLSSVDYYLSLDSKAWVPHVWTACDNLEPGQTCSFCSYPKVEQYVRISGRSSRGTTLQVAFAKRTWKPCR